MAKNSDAKINGDFKGKDIITLSQFSPSDIELLFQKANQMKQIVTKNKPSQLLAGYVIGLIFYEPSSRTFGSFSSAAKRLGAATIEYTNPKENTSVAKGESLEDTMQTIQSYTEAIVIRHPESGSAQIAADAADVPIVNAGDGGNAHPTQTLYDLYTIYDKFKRLDNLKVLATGDILHSRTIRSLIEGLSLYKNNTVYLLSPKELELSRDFFTKLSNKVNIVEINDEKDIPKDAHVWYWNRIQKERFASLEEAEKYKKKFILTKDLLKTYGNDTMIILDPLPRVGEIEVTVDSDPRAVYLRYQMRYGLYIRMAILALVLGKI